MTRGAHRAAAPGRQRRPFSVADELSCYFDTPDEPANVHVEVAVTGRLDLDALRAAALGALRASPRATARRAASSPLARYYVWEPADDFDVDPVSFRTFGDAQELAAIRSEFIARAPAVTTCPPVAVLIASGPAGEHVILNAHHAAMDGMSCLEMLRDVGRRYRRRTGGGPAPVPSPVSDQPRAAIAQPAQPPPAGQAAMRRPRPSRPARIAPDGGGQRGCAVLIRQLPAVPAVPAGAGPATLNDALITALIITVGRWNAEHGRPVRDVRVTVPVNARQAAGRPAAGNHSRLVTITGSPPAAGADATPLLLDVAAQVRRARLQPGPVVDPGSARIAALWCPAVVKRCLVRAALRIAGPLASDTVMLTNLGRVADLPDFGQPEQVSLAFSSSAHMPRGASVGVVTAAGQPAIAVRYNRALVDASAADRFLGGYLTAIDELTTPAPPSGAGAARQPRPRPALVPPTD